jgi:hypothetical protein
MKNQHGSKIDYISINSTSKFAVSSSVDSINVWSLKPAKHLINIPLDENKISKSTIATIDTTGTILVVYRKE